jgi:hypothetical protein
MAKRDSLGIRSGSQKHMHLGIFIGDEIKQSLSKLPSKKKLNNSKQSSFKDSALRFDPLMEEVEEELKVSDERLNEESHDTYFYQTSERFRFSNDYMNR